ncbi:MAG: MerR family transcriptional regulator [Eubacteriales bacterium]|nr:MerR family transcriptional regulator [Eubacteriales bacterium]
MGYTIKQISEKTSISPYVLRYYEKEGLLPHVSRSDNGFRFYSEEDLEWLGLICCLKNTGMSLKQIKAFVDLSAEGKDTLKQRCEMLVEHKRNVENQVQEMQKQLEKVSRKIVCFTAQYDEYRNDVQGGSR